MFCFDVGDNEAAQQPGVACVCSVTTAPGHQSRGSNWQLGALEGLVLLATGIRTTLGLGRLAVVEAILGQVQCIARGLYKAAMMIGL